MFVLSSEQIIHGDPAELGGTGGVILLDRKGHFATPFNTEGMYRSWADEQGRITVRIYGPE